MRQRTKLITWSLGVIAATGMVMGVWAQAAPPKGEESERVVKESEVPAAALDALKKLAGSAKIMKFEEETEHGSKFYECEWSAEGGKKDACVTEHGDLVELEEMISESATPKAVVAAAKKAAGADASLRVEKKTLIMYEVKFEKQGKRHEIVLTPDGRSHEHEDEDNDGEHDDD